MSDQAVAAPPKAPLMESIASELGLADGRELYLTFAKTLMPARASEPSREEVLAFFTVARKYGLDPWTRQIMAFPMQGGGIRPMVGYDGWLAIVASKPDYMGHEFEFEWPAAVKAGDEDIGPNTRPIACTVTFRRKRGEEVIESRKTCYFHEWVMEKNPNWGSRPIHMLEVRTFCQGARATWGISGIYTEDELEEIDAREAEYELKNDPAPKPAATDEMRDLGSTLAESNAKADEKEGATEEAAAVKSTSTRKAKASKKKTTSRKKGAAKASEPKDEEPSAEESPAEKAEPPKEPKRTPKTERAERTGSGDPADDSGVDQMSADQATELKGLITEHGFEQPDLAWLIDTYFPGESLDTLTFAQAGELLMRTKGGAAELRKLVVSEELDSDDVTWILTTYFEGHDSIKSLTPEKLGELVTGLREGSYFEDDDDDGGDDENE